MKHATLNQAGKILALPAQKGTPHSQIQELLSSGILADLFDKRAKISEVDRKVFRNMIGLSSPNFNIPLRHISGKNDCPKQKLGCRKKATYEAAYFFTEDTCISVLCCNNTKCMVAARREVYEEVLKRFDEDDE